MPLTKINDTVTDFSYGDVYEYTDAVGLDVSFSGGVVTDNEDVFTSSPVTLTLPDDAVTEIVLNFTNGEITIADDVDGFSFILIYEITTASGVVTSITDHRSAFVTKTQVQSAPSGLVISPYFQAVADESPHWWITGSDQADQIDFTNGLVTNIGGGDGMAMVRGPYASMTQATAGPGGIGMDAIKLASGCNLGFSHQPFNNVSTGFTEWGMWSMWFKLSALPSSGNFYLWMQRDVDNDGIYSYARVSDAGALSTRIYTTATNETLTTSTSTISADTWHFVVVKAANDTAVNTLWVDGVLDQTGTVDTWNIDTGFGINTGAWAIGNADWSRDGDHTDTPPGALVQFALTTDQSVDMEFSNFTWHNETTWSDAEILANDDIGRGI